MGYDNLVTISQQIGNILPREAEKGMDGEMRKAHAARRFSRGAVSLLMALVLLLSLCPGEARAVVEKDDKTRAIAIVLDNSGSMYMNGNQAWCRATYGIEVFAAMMNSGDTLAVYPMWPVEANGVEYTDEMPLTVKGGGDLSAIRQMYTPSAGGTPIETIRSASEGLKTMQADEKWLIVLTDGNEFYEDNVSFGADTAAKLSEALTECNRSMNVMYLGIGGSAVIPEVTSPGRYTYYADKANDTQAILSKLTAMSNSIFGRDALATSGSEMSFDLSMSKLIVFVQGEGVADITLSAKDGNGTMQAVDSYSPHYAERGAGGRYANAFGIDRSLQGVLMTYEDVDAGAYTIGFSGKASSVNVYYEPDVDLRIAMLNEDGEEVTPDTAYPGTYTVSAQLVDKNGNPTNSALLGTTNYRISCTVNGEEHASSGDSAGAMEITLAEGDSVEFGAEVGYLSGYHIEKTGSDMGWPEFTVLPPPGYEYALTLDVPQSYIVLSKIKEAEPIEVNLYLNGAPITQEALAMLDISVEGDGIAFTTARKADNTGFLLRLDPNTSVTAGSHSFTCHVTGLDDNGEPVSLSDGASLTFKPYPQWVIYLAVFLILALIALLIWLFLNMKMLPRRVDVTNTEFVVDGERVNGRAVCRYTRSGNKKGTLTVIAPRCPTNPFAKGSFTLEVEAVSPRRVRSASRGMHVVSVNTDRAMNSVKVSASRFAKDSNGKLVKAGARPGSPVSFDIYSGARCSMSGEALDGDGGSVSMSMSAKLIFS